MIKELMLVFIPTKPPTDICAIKSLTDNVWKLAELASWQGAVYGETKVKFIHLDTIDEIAIGWSGSAPYDIVMADPEFRQNKKETIIAIKKHLENHILVNIRSV